MELKPCPFCGNSATIRKVIWTNGANRSGVIPDGAELVSEHKSVSGKTLYFWQRYGYTVTCETIKCICHTSSTKYRSEEEAETMWNTRI